MCAPLVYQGLFAFGSESVSVIRRPSGQIHCDALRGARRIFSGSRYEGPGQEFLDVVDRMIRDAGQHVAQVELRV